MVDWGSCQRIFLSENVVGSRIWTHDLSLIETCHGPNNSFSLVFLVILATIHLQSTTVLPEITSSPRTTSIGLTSSDGKGAPRFEPGAADLDARPPTPSRQIFSFWCLSRFWETGMTRLLNRLGFVVSKNKTVCDKKFLKGVEISFQASVFIFLRKNNSRPRRDEKSEKSCAAGKWKTQSCKKAKTKLAKKNEEDEFSFFFLSFSLPPLI